MFILVYPPHGLAEQAPDLSSHPLSWLREDEGYTGFAKAWERCCEINANDEQISCLVASTINGQLYFPKGMVPNYPFEGEL
jgi:hypothetical protein